MLNLTFLSVVLLLVGCFSGIETSVITRSVPRGASEYEQREQSFPVEETYAYQYPETSESYSEDIPFYQTGRAIAVDGMPSEYTPSFSPYVMSDMPTQRASTEYQSPQDTPLPSHLPSYAAPTPIRPTSKQAVHTNVNEEPTKQPSTAPSSTHDLDSSSTTFNPPRIEKAAMAALEPLTSVVSNRAQATHIINAPINLLSGKDSTPDFGFVNNKNIDGQLRKVTYGVDAQGNIVAHSAQVVNS
ncbi:hypothetical protein MJO28_004564 [Puccinia striiformis f. sp. tritici]|uniref:Uncharacterized protein n=3 Tax=Puccinia striiformis TaxID=27350 RepID=A0A0L0VAS5_9BASI|nr:uncharacterized protein Pst134EA_031996 [Puccinia striiformis f. sp. tritici]XP_047808992.1 hypothetical protein Pst134EA_006832 [Puccinia striiformis f. sp. tritici]KAI9608851.1 hypothetical protein H4Q26_005040 [Puccinia striiformis f. sp. tritici PST-130]KNE96372.1 hypothetical protein PSTG_10338 [Puccinia striiformis f. sp. tritici PST-78]POW04237.1 hypothetical protein PSTT_10557 [Puccinia striiformis]KAH9441952.1 hypothetical protein Pst134EA_031996 [Puccinia striiformis f. sp. tritic